MPIGDSTGTIIRPAISVSWISAVVTLVGGAAVLLGFGMWQFSYFFDNPPSVVAYTEMLFGFGMFVVHGAYKGNPRWWKRGWTWILAGGLVGGWGCGTLPEVREGIIAKRSYAATLRYESLISEGGASPAKVEKYRDWAEHWGKLSEAVAGVNRHSGDAQLLPYALMACSVFFLMNGFLLVSARRSLWLADPSVLSEVERPT